MILYGLTPDSITSDNQGTILPGTQAQIFATLTAGSTFGQIYAFDGTMTPGAQLPNATVTSDADGRIAFWADNTGDTLYLEFNDGTGRWPMNPTETSKIVQDLSDSALAAMQTQLDQAIVDHQADIDVAVTTANEAKATAEGVEAVANSALSSASAAQQDADAALAWINSFPRINVKNEGALGDGATDDRVAFINAITKIRDAGGGEIYIPPGTYVVNDVVELCSNLKITGDSAVITKTVWSPYSVFVALSHGTTGYGSSVQRVTCTGVTFRGDFANNNSICGFALHHAQDVKIERCTFDQAQGTGHCIDACGCDGLVVDNCDFLGFNNHLTGGFNRAEAIEIDISVNGALSYADDAGSYDGLLTRNVIVSNSRFLPKTVGATTYPCPNPLGAHGQIEGRAYTNVTFQNNVVTDPTEDLPPSTGDNSWLVGVLHFPTVDGLQVIGNTFRQTKGKMQRVIAVVSRSFGILASNNFNLPSPTEGNWTTPVASRNIVIRDNSIFGFSPDLQTLSQPAVYVAGVANGKIDNAIISGNNIRNGYSTTNATGNFAIFLENDTRAEISGNSIFSYMQGIHVKGSDTVSVTGNILDQLYDWTMLFTTDTGVAITGNTIRRYRRPIQTQADVSEVALTGNVFLSTQTTGTNANGIVISGSSRYVVSGNLISNSGAVQPRGMAVGAGTHGAVVGNVTFGYTDAVTPVAPPATITYANNTES